MKLIITYIIGASAIFSAGAQDLVNSASGSGTDGNTNISFVMGELLAPSSNTGGGYNQLFVTRETIVLSSEEFTIDDILVYPNPTTDVVYLKSKQNNSYKYSVSNLLGQQISSGNLNGAPINFTDLERGVYLIKVTSGLKKSVFKIIKK